MAVIHNERFPQTSFPCGEREVTSMEPRRQLRSCSHHALSALCLSACTLLVGLRAEPQHGQHELLAFKDNERRVRQVCQSVQLDGGFSLRAPWDVEEPDIMDGLNVCDKVRTLSDWGPVLSVDLQRCACLLHHHGQRLDALRMMRAARRLLPPIYQHARFASRDCLIAEENSRFMM